LLQTAGVAAEQIPPGLEARVRLWRDHLAGKQMLIVLDDAIGHDQVRPLLPGTAGSLVLVTSRRRLTALEDAQTISLDFLTPDESVSLLIRLAARPDLTASDPAAAAISSLCGYLPLAVGMLAMQLRHHPTWTATDLAADLASARDRLGLMTAENLSVTAAFDLSYQDLTGEQQRLFRRLGLFPGNDFDAYAAAALDDCGLVAARRSLEALYEHHLIAEPARGRYRLHDLIRVHARALAATDPLADSDAATLRLLDYYLETARAASRHFTRRTPPAVPAVAVVSPASAPDLRARADAVAWMESERLNVHAAVGYAAVDERLGHAADTAAAMHGFLRSQGHWDQALTMHRAVLEGAGQAGDRLAEAAALTNLGDLQRLTADFPAAAVSLTRAAELYDDRGDRFGEAGALTELGIVQRYTVEYPAATASLSLALELYEDGGDRLGQAGALTELGAVQYLSGNLRSAVTTLSRALELCRQVRNPLVEASALDHLGVVQRATGNYQAAVSHEQALELHRGLGNRFGEASAHADLAVVRLRTGEHAAAAAGLASALDLYRGLGARVGEAEVLNTLGELSLAEGADRAALAYFESARAIATSIDLLPELARATEGSGRCHLLAGDRRRAEELLGQALASYRKLGSPRADRLEKDMPGHDH
jgi:tetratricopeptide (TPR) repeat protein